MSPPRRSRKPPTNCNPLSLIQSALQIEKQLNAKNTKSAKAPNPDPLQPLIEDPLALVAGREDLWIN